LPSADTVGRVSALIDPAQVRAVQRQVYAALKRGKALWPPEGFTTWETVPTPVRLVRSQERQPIRQPLDGAVDDQTSEWFWVTTLAPRRVSTAAVVDLGHGRWGIENEGFNQLATEWHADHADRHEPTALVVFWLLAFLCLNLFAAFYRRNLKPARRQTSSVRHVTRLITAELFGSLPRAVFAVPP
jgi:hypothetical protein